MLDSTSSVLPHLDAKFSKTGKAPSEDEGGSEVVASAKDDPRA